MARQSTETQPSGNGLRQCIRTNDEWLAALQQAGAGQQAAIEDLRDYLLRVVCLYLFRSRSDLAHLDHGELRQLAEDCVQEALMLIVAKLGTFRGDSKFTTWAYRVAINQAAGKLRRRQWRDVSLDALNEGADQDSRPLSQVLPDESTGSPDGDVTRRQIWQLIRHVIRHQFSERQRLVFMNQYFRGVPPAVIAERLGTNRNNIYKVSHDARVKLKKHLITQDLTVNEILTAFQ